jgi:hypothetical protein
VINSDGATRPPRVHRMRASVSAVLSLQNLRLSGWPDHEVSCIGLFGPLSRATHRIAPHFFAVLPSCAHVKRAEMGQQAPPINASFTLVIN